jgi:hypothetical protein
MKSAELACRFCGQPIVFRIDDNNAYQAADDIHTDFLQHILQRKHVCVYIASVAYAMAPLQKIVAGNAERARLHGQMASTTMCGRKNTL